MYAYTNDIAANVEHVVIATHTVQLARCIIYTTTTITTSGRKSVAPLSHHWLLGDSGREDDNHINQAHIISDRFDKAVVLMRTRTAILSFSRPA